MERSRTTALWTVSFWVDDLGCQVMLCNRCRVVMRLEWDGEYPDRREVQLQEARERAVELALEYRVPLTEVSEGTYRYMPGGR